MQTVVARPSNVPLSVAALSKFFSDTLVVVSWERAQYFDGSNLPPGLQLALVFGDGIGLIVEGEFREFIKRPVNGPALNMRLALDILGSRFPGHVVWVVRTPHDPAKSLP